MTQLLISAVGPDRPGIVGELTGRLHDAGGNLLDSRMVNLRGQFAMMLVVEVPADSAERVAEALPAAGREMGLELTVQPAPQAPAAVEGMRYRLKTYSLDQPGIIARLSKVLRDRGVNIEELSARQESAAFAGDPLFIAEMRLTIPKTVPLRALRDQLEALCSEMNCDIDLDPA